MTKIGDSTVNDIVERERERGMNKTNQLNIKVWKHPGACSIGIINH